MLARILAFIMSILMTIFPFFGEKNTVSNEEVAEAVIYAVEKKDASAIEAVMCKNIKDNFDVFEGMTSLKNPGVAYDMKITIGNKKAPQTRCFFLPSSSVYDINS